MKQILNEKVRVVESVQPYPGEIHLPMDLYSRRSVPVFGVGAVVSPDGRNALRSPSNAT